MTRSLLAKGGSEKEGWQIERFDYEDRDTLFIGDMLSEILREVSNGDLSRIFAVCRSEDADDIGHLLQQKLGIPYLSILDQ